MLRLLQSPISFGSPCSGSGKASALNVRLIHGHYDARHRRTRVIPWREDMKFAQAIRAGITAILAPLFSIAFVGVPLVIGGGILAASAEILFLPA